MRHRSFFLLLILLTAAIFCIASTASAEVDWDILKSMDLQETPLDIAIARDGDTVFILGEKSIQIYSLRQSRFTGAIPLSRLYSGLALSPDGETLLLTDAENKQLTVMLVTPVCPIEIGQSPVIGNPNAPVTIVAFSDYQ